ncbi:MAG: hypothetical protein GC154_21105 [bacterium]|nr:hypothetical protein [bacterium]
MTDYVPLAFGFEAIYPPMGLSSTQLRDYYNRVAEPCRFTEFRQLGGGQGARLAEGNNRHLTLSPDRVVYHQDDFTQALFSTYCEDARVILRHLREVFQTPVLLHCKVMVRLLMPHAGPENAFEFFQKNLLQSAAPRFDSFGRALSGVGLRFVFPPTQQNHSTFHLRLEPYFRDLKMFYIENQAQFFDPLVNYEDMQNYLDATYNFLKEKGGPFILGLANGGE